MYPRRKCPSRRSQPAQPGSSAGNLRCSSQRTEQRSSTAGWECRTLDRWPRRAKPQSQLDCIRPDCGARPERGNPGMCLLSRDRSLCWAETWSSRSTVSPRHRWPGVAELQCRERAACSSTLHARPGSCTGHRPTHPRTEGLRREPHASQATHRGERGAHRARPGQSERGGHGGAEPDATQGNSCRKRQDP